MPPQEGCAIYKRPPDKRSTVFFLCRKRHGYTRDLRSVCGNKRYRRSFNAASGNAIRATMECPWNHSRICCFNAASCNAIRATRCLLSVQRRLGGFNAASGNAIRATSETAQFLRNIRGRFNAASGNAIRATSEIDRLERENRGFNAASGNAIRATMRVITTAW